MSNAYDTMRQMLEEAKQANNAADRYADTCAEIIAGRMKRIRPYLLKKLKRELRKFNIHTGEWAE